MLDLSQLHVQKIADRAKLLKNFEAICACCDAKLPKFPTRSITCKICSKKSYAEENVIYGKKVLVTEEDKEVLRSLASEQAELFQICRIEGHELSAKILKSASNDAYWRQLNISLIDNSRNLQSVLKTLYQMFLLACHENNYSSAFERLPGIISLKFGNLISEHLAMFDQESMFLTFGTPIFHNNYLQRMVSEKDLPYLKELMTNPEYKSRYDYYYNLCGFDSEIVWQCIETEYRGRSDFFKYLYTQVINPPVSVVNTTPKSLLSKIKSKFFNQ